MTAHFHFAYDFARIGPAIIQFEEQAGGAHTITYSTGVFANVGPSSRKNLYQTTGIGGESVFSFPLDPPGVAAADPTFIGQLLSDMTGGGTLTATYKLSSFDGLHYQITTTAGINWRLGAATNSLGQSLLGRTSFGYGATMTSSTAIRYSIDAAAGYLSEMSDDYEPPEIAADAETDGLLGGGIAWSRPPVYQDFSLHVEPVARVLKRTQNGSDWVQTWQTLWEHARNTMPFMVVIDPAYTVTGAPNVGPYVSAVQTHCSVHKLRAEGASFKPMREVPDYDAYWSLRFLTRVIERGYDG